MENKTRKITGIAAGALAITALNVNSSNAADLVTFNNLGSGAELRSELISSAVSFIENGVASMNIEAKCGEKSKTSTATKGKEGKCGEKGKEGKCGEKGKEGKCGEKGKEGKCGEKGKEAKCGEKGKEAKCGEKTPK